MIKKPTIPFDATELNSSPRPLLRAALIILAYLCVFTILDFFTLVFEEQPGIVAWYPPAGLAYAFLLVFGVRFTPVVTIALFISCLFIYRMPQPLYALFLWAFLISLIYGGAAAFMRYRIHFDWHLRKMRDVTWLVFMAVFVSALLAILSVSSSALSGNIPLSEIPRAIFHWWIGETVGVLTITPFLLIYVIPWLKRLADGETAKLPGRRIFPRPSLIAIGQTFSLVFILYWVFGTHILEELQPLYLISLPLIWIALQRGLKGATTGIMVLNFGVVFALWFVRSDFARLGELQLLMIINCIEGLLMGAIVTERKSFEQDLQQITKDWEETFDILNESITIHDIDFNITRSNKASERLLGQNAQEILSAKCFASYHGKDCPPKGCPSCESLKTGNPAVFEIFEPHLNKFLEVKALPRLDEKNSIVGLVHIVRDITERKNAEVEREQIIAKLRKTLEQVKQLSGLIPICSSCKKIRDDNGYWNEVADYIADHSEAEFTHGMCPDCMKKWYPDFYPEK